MAACGGIEHIFEKPLPEPQNFLEAALSPWKHIKALKNPNSNVDDSSFTEIFGELHFKESHLHDHNNNNNNNNSSSSNPASAAREIQAADQDREKGSNGNYCPSSSQRRQNKHSQSFSSDSLSLCTEGLGFESCDEVEETSSHDEFSSREWQDVVRNPSQRDEPPKGGRAGSGAGTGAFPPPISCIGRSGKPWVCFKSYREDGRFILKEVRIPTQEFLHACRGDGRLQLHFVQSDDEDEQIEAEAVDVGEEEHNQELA